MCLQLRIVLTNIINDTYQKFTNSFVGFNSFMLKPFNLISVFQSHWEHFQEINSYWFCFHLANVGAPKCYRALWLVMWRLCLNSAVTLQNM